VSNLCYVKKMKITYYVATSSDGFIAREDGDVSWLDEMNIDLADAGYDGFFESIDGLVMGRKTYDFIFNYRSWPYEDKPAWICTSSEIEILEGANLEIAKKPEDVLKDAESIGSKHLWLVGGGKLASSFLEDGLLTHLWISEMPIKLESGIPLFADHKLESLSSEKTEILQKKGFKEVKIVLRDYKNR
jgi:dihydrofolate reductase